MDKNRQTKQSGPNPFSYLGITYSASGMTATLHEIVSGQWREYDKVDAGASFQVPAVPEQYRGKGFNFGDWYPVYDWIANDGYNNFSNWIG